MKAKYILYVLACACVFSACSRDEESLFDKSAAERAQEALENANQVLTGAESGWEMLYFANLNSRGYNMIVRFKKDGQVVVSAKNATTTGNKLLTDSSSTWDVKNDYGPILTFDTYNDVFHAWSDPGNDGDGLLGDYEFLIIQAKPELVILKGKKHSAYTILRPMPNMEADAYFTQCNSLLATYFGNNAIMTLQQGNGLYYLHEGSTGLFNITPVGEKAADVDPVLYPICPTLDGFMMSYGFNGDKEERLFTLEGDKFVGGKGSVIFAGQLNLLFRTYIDLNKGWVIDQANSTGAFATAAEAFQTQIQTLSGDNTAKLKSVALSYNDTVFRYQGSDLIRIEFEYKQKGRKITNTLHYAASVKLEGAGISVSYIQPINSVSTTWYAQQTIVDLINAVVGTYSLEAINHLNPAKGMKLSNERSILTVSGSTGLK